MTFDVKRIYYNALFGALGGLVSWLLIGLFLRFGTTSLFLLFLKDALLGAVVGICIGGAIGMVDGVTTRSIGKLLRGIIYGGIIGLVAGMVGLVIGEIIFNLAGGGVWPRAVGWALFGLLVGTSEGVANRAPAKASYGAIGGVLGGLIGGSTYERLSDLLRMVTHNRDLALTIGGAVGLIILGACIGSIIGLVEDILRHAWLRCLYGPLEGRTLTIAKTRVVLGKADDCDLVLPGDPEMAPHHAEINQTTQGFTINAQEGAVLVNTQQVTQNALNNEDEIKLGRTRLIFYVE